MHERRVANRGEQHIHQRFINMQAPIVFDEAHCIMDLLARYSQNLISRSRTEQFDTSTILQEDENGPNPIRSQ